MVAHWVMDEEFDAEETAGCMPLFPTVQVVRLVPQEQVQWIDEHMVDALQFLEQLVDVLSLIPQKHRQLINEEYLGKDL